MDAGRFDQSVSVLSLAEDAGSWAWTEARKTWARVEEGTGKNLFSSVGLGAKSLKLTLRKQVLTLDNAILWRGRHCFLTDIRDNGRLYLDVDAAVVEPVSCRAEGFKSTLGEGNRPQREAGPVVVFPGVMTEKYAGYTREEAHASAETTYVLVTPKVVVLHEGDLITVQDGPAQAVYNVRVCHVLDSHKNEYEMCWNRDV